MAAKLFNIFYIYIPFGVFVYFSFTFDIQKKRMNDSVISDIFPRSSNMRLVHSSYIAVIRSYISYVTAIHNAFTIHIVYVWYKQTGVG